MEGVRRKGRFQMHEKQARKGQKRAAEEMLQVAKRNCNRAAIGNSVVLGIPKVDRGPLDLITLQSASDRERCVPGWYKLWNPENWFSRNDFILSGSTFTGDVPEKTHKSSGSSGYGIKIWGAGVFWL